MFNQALVFGVSDEFPEKAEKWNEMFSMVNGALEEYSSWSVGEYSDPAFFDILEALKKLTAVNLAYIRRHWLNGSDEKTAVLLAALMEDILADSLEFESYVSETH